MENIAEKETKDAGERKYGITGKDVWSALEKDVEYMALFQSEGQKEVMREYVENNLLIVIGDMLHERVSVESLVKANLTYFKDLLSSGIISKMAEATPEENLGFFSASAMLEMLEAMMVQIVEMFERMLENVPEFLEENEISEEYFYQAMKLNQENIENALNGGLTIGELLLSQPSVIIATNKDG